MDENPYKAPDQDSAHGIGEPESQKETVSFFVWYPLLLFAIALFWLFLVGLAGWIRGA
jgi:hypothetical protein